MAYIERKKLLERFEVLKENADTLRDRIYLDGILATIDSFPAADVVEVVHCKNCKCFEKFQAGHFCNRFGGIVTKEDYCSRGERKDGEG